MCVRRRADRLPGMTSGRGVLTALHLFLVWAAMAAAMPVLGFELVVTAWGGGAGAAVPVLALSVPLMGECKSNGGSDDHGRDVK